MVLDSRFPTLLKLECGFAGFWCAVCVSSCACLCIHFDIFGIVVDAFREEEIEENVEEEEE